MKIRNICKPQSYCDTSYSRGGVDQMWILKNSKDLLDYKQSRSLSSCNNIRTYDLSTLYTTIRHSKLKSRLRELVQLYFIKKKYPNIQIPCAKILFCNKKKNSGSTKTLSSTCSNFLLTTYLFCLVGVFFN